MWVNAIGFEGEGLKEIIEDARLEDSNHFEALVPRIYELGGELHPSLNAPGITTAFDVRTGANLYPRNVYPANLTLRERDLSPLHLYRVRVEGNVVLVEF